MESLKKKKKKIKAMSEFDGRRIFDNIHVQFVGL